MSASFDSAAANYDATFSATEIGKAQRKLVWNYLQQKVNSNWNVLELTAGTGVDAAWLSNKVQHIHVTDASAAMLEIAKKSVKSKNSSFQVIDAESMDGLEGSFHLVFSNFGGLNCLSPTAWKSFSNRIKTRLLPGGDIILIIISSSCWWEKLYFTLKRNKKEANRRSTGYAEANVNGEKIPLWYYSPQEVKSFFGSEFELVKHCPIGFLVPPSYLNNAFQKLPWLIKFFYHVDKLLMSFSLLSNKADHFLIHLKKTH